MYHKQASKISTPVDYTIVSWFYIKRTEKGIGGEGWVGYNWTKTCQQSNKLFHSGFLEGLTSTKTIIETVSNS